MIPQLTYSDMKFTEQQIFALRSSIEPILSHKRFMHTLGVEAAAVSIGKFFPELDISELRVAALCHDVTKELSDEVQLTFIDESNVSANDLMTPQVLHSLSAPKYILRHFSEYATDAVLSAVLRHTTGDYDMTVFDEVIFIADYVEEGRIYDACVSLRTRLYSALESSRSASDAACALHCAALESINNTIIAIINSGRILNERAVSARNYLIGVLSDMYGGKGLNNE